MRLIVISDTHQQYSNVSRVIERTKDTDTFFFLGDSESEYRLLCRNYPGFINRSYYVKGNCDYGCDAPLEQIIDICPGHRVYAVHGHRLNVNSSTEWLVRAARENECDIALYGHTHVSHCAYVDGVYILNPGSTSCPRDGKPPSFGVVDVSSAGVMTNVVFL